MARKDPSPNLIAEIDALEAKLKARLDDFVAEERALRPGLPESVHRSLLLRNDSNIFRAMKRLLTEREAERAA